MKIIKRIGKTSVGQKIIGFLIFLITKFVFCSIKWDCIDKKTKDLIFKNKRSYIFCCWHNRLFLGPYFLPKNLIINALQSSHSDGMMTAVIFKLIKFNIIFGSSMKGGAKAFIKMIKSINRGESIAITPDGPKGPKEKVKDGIIKLAQVTGAPIVPLVWSTNKSNSMTSWDNFLIPYPFSKGLYLFGRPIYINRDLSEKNFEKKKMQVENELNHLTTLVDKKLLEIS